MKLRCLQAEHGDAFIIEIGDGAEKHYVVVDGGPSSKYCIDDIVRELNKLPQIDLMVLSHYDDDHIAGLLEYVKGHQQGNLPVKQIWSNCSKDIHVSTSSTISYGQAQTLETLLERIADRQVLIKENNINNTLPKKDFGFCKIQILSPSSESLMANIEKYMKETGTIASTRVEVDSRTLEVLANNKTKKCKDGVDAINRSSIAFTIEAEGKTFLMMGDADPWIVLAKLNELGYTEDNPLKVDLMKVSHHGSKNNTCNELLDALNCSNYLISTNGGYGNAYHPDRETIAKILLHSKRNSKVPTILYFNYDLKDIEKRIGTLLTKEEAQKHNCQIKRVVVYPEC